MAVYNIIAAIAGENVGAEVIVLIVVLRNLTNNIVIGIGMREPLIGSDRLAGYDTIVTNDNVRVVTTADRIIAVQAIYEVMATGYVVLSVATKEVVVTLLAENEIVTIVAEDQVVTSPVGSAIIDGYITLKFR